MLYAISLARRAQNAFGHIHHPLQGTLNKGVAVTYWLIYFTIYIVCRYTVMYLTPFIAVDKTSYINTRTQKSLSESLKVTNILSIIVINYSRLSTSILNIMMYSTDSALKIMSVIIIMIILAGYYGIHILSIKLLSK
jgi:hypothetical protein